MDKVSVNVLVPEIHIGSNKKMSNTIIRTKRRLKINKY